MRKAFAVLLVLIILLVVVPGWFLSKGKTLGNRHDDVPAAEFDYSNSNFRDYIAYYRQRLPLTRADQPDAQVLENLLPFELPLPEFCERSAAGKAPKGVLLIHGLIASPYSMKDLGVFLQSQCFHVYGLLLPDHGSRPGELLSASWQDWAQATHFATEQLAQVAEQIILSGHSAGATLAILEAEDNPAADALLLFAPALQITAAARYARFIVPYGKLFSKAAWYEVRPDEALYRHESIPFASAAQTYALIQHTLAFENEHLHALPVFTVASVEDNTVATSAIIDFMSRNKHADSHTLLYSQHAYPDSDRLTVVPSNSTEQGVLSLSHLGLMTAPSHDYYGRDGSYRNCGHYGTAENDNFVRCKIGERAWYGEATAENLQQGIVERIAFNPYFDAMLADMMRFLKKL